MVSVIYHDRSLKWSPTRIFSARNNNDISIVRKDYIVRYSVRVIYLGFPYGPPLSKDVVSIQ